MHSKWTSRVLQGRPGHVRIEPADRDVTSDRHAREHEADERGHRDAELRTEEPQIWHAPTLPACRPLRMTRTSWVDAGVTIAS